MHFIQDQDVMSLIHNNGGLNAFLLKTLTQLKCDYRRIDEFTLDARLAFHHPKGVIETMPIADDYHFAMKWVTGHPENPDRGLPSIVSMGVLAEMETGQPIVFCDMNILTAIRTAAVNAMMAQQLLDAKPVKVAIIGTGAQAEFQSHALSQVLTIEELMYFDLSQHTMDKFAYHMKKAPFPTTQASLEACVTQADVIVTLTASKAHQDVMNGLWPKEGAVILATGGDCPGKTELRRELLEVSDIVVPMLKQARIEGEIQQLPEEYPVQTITEFLQYPQRTRPYFVFDSIGIALEDFSILRVLSRYTPPFQEDQQDPKDLFKSVEHQWL